MKFVLAFEHSGDTLPFTCVNDQVLEYYVDQLNTRNANSFALTPGFGNTVADYVQELDTTIHDVNSWIFEILDGYISRERDYFDQRVLNQIHLEWAQAHNKVYPIAYKRSRYNNSEQSELIHSRFNDDTPAPTVSTVLQNLGLIDQYSKINIKVHQLEDAFTTELVCISTPWVEIDNPYPDSILTNDVCNFKIAFQHLGRSLYEKFRTFDMDLEFDDENTFRELIGAVSITLQPEQQVPFSKQYREWCQRHNRTPSGRGINIGTIDQLNERLTDYRKILFRNSRQDNKFSIQLNKG